MNQNFIALLEWMGWTHIHKDMEAAVIDGWFPPYVTDISFSNIAQMHGEHPPLTLDLMHEAEGKLTREQQDEYVNRHLYDLLPCDENHGPCDGEDGDDILIASQFQVAHATKEQRLEALLKTINQWKETA